MELFERMRKIQKEMESMFKDLSKNFGMIEGLKGIREPVCDVKERKNDVVVSVELPGVDKKDIQLVVRDSSIEIKAEKKKETRIVKKGFFKEEKGYRGFYRVLSLPASVKPEQAEAEYENGVLSVKIPKKTEKIKVKEKKVRIK
jgi:HSP20 family protein